MKVTQLTINRFVSIFSAGVGRTGTFMVIDSMLDRIKAENTIDIFNFVAYLRTRRTAMVQTEVCSEFVMRCFPANTCGTLLGFYYGFWEAQKHTYNKNTEKTKSTVLSKRDGNLPGKLGLLTMAGMEVAV